MELAIMERIQLLNILPVEGNLVTVRILKKLREELGFTEQEIKDYSIESRDYQIVWKEDGYVLNIDIGEKATEIIKDALKKMDESGKVTEQLLPLYDKFMGE